MNRLVLRFPWADCGGDSEKVLFNLGVGMTAKAFAWSKECSMNTPRKLVRPEMISYTTYQHSVSCYLLPVFIPTSLLHSRYNGHLVNIPKCQICSSFRVLHLAFPSAYEVFSWGRKRAHFFRTLLKYYLNREMFVLLRQQEKQNHNKYT